MQDQGFGDVRVSSAFDDPKRMGGTADVADPPKPKKQHKLDTPESQKRLSRLREWFEQEWQRQAHNRYQMALDEDYYDSMQWSEEDAQVLQERGQAPLVFNEIKPTIDWLLGTERRTRVDFKVLPRKKEGNDDAENKTKLLKYLGDVNKAKYGRSRAFADAVKAGVGWIETGLRGDPTEELLYERAENWRYVLYDSNSVEPDLSDARYQFRWKWIDKDIAEAYFPERAHLIKRSTIDGNKMTLEEQDGDIWYMGARVTQPGQDYAGASTGKYRPYDGSAFAWSRRARVKLIECWYVEPARRKVFARGDFEGEVFDARNPEHLLARKQASLFDRVQLEMRCAIFCEAGLLYDGASPFRHGRFPLTPIWCYRRKRDNAPYGVIRSLRDAQDDLNKRHSKALWLLSTNRVTMDKGAVEDPEELREEVARPDSLIEKKKGYDLKVERDTQLAREHLDMMDRDALMIRQSGGVNNDNLGRETNATSGKAIIARQDQGSVVTTEIFDNLEFASQIVGEIELSNVEQFYTDEKVIRLVGERGNATFVELNKPNPDNPDEILNDVTAHQADFVVSRQDYRDSLRQAMFESLFEIVGRLAQMSPDVALNMLDLVVEMVDVPGRDELVARIRKINGQRDPESEPTPEELAAEQENAHYQQLQKELAIGRMQAELAEIIAKKEDMSADTIKTRLEAMYTALQAAQVISAAPAAAVIADEVMTGAGYADKSLDAQQELVDKAADQMEGGAPALPAEPGPPSSQEGVRRGIHTPENDGVIA